MCHVLIIEDDPIAAMDIRATLARVGATSFSFADTEREALASARDQRPEVIISDVVLSNGFGPQAVRAIHAELGAIPAIFVTATPDQCFGSPPERILEKPFSTDALSTLFRTVAPPLGPRAWTRHEEARRFPRSTGPLCRPRDMPLAQGCIPPDR